MRYVAFLKNNIAVAKSIYKSLSDVKSRVYDGFEELEKREFEKLELPAKKIDGVWTKVDNAPSIVYPETPTKAEPTTDELLDILLGVM